MFFPSLMCYFDDYRCFWAPDLKYAFLENVCVYVCMCVCICMLWTCPRHNSKLDIGMKFIFGRYLKFILKLCKFNYTVDWIIIIIKKRKTKNIEKSKFFFCRRVGILLWCKPIFLKDLTLPIIPYFCRPDRVTLSRLKKK